MLFGFKWTKCVACKLIYFWFTEGLVLFISVLTLRDSHFVTMVCVALANGAVCSIWCVDLLVYFIINAIIPTFINTYEQININVSIIYQITYHVIFIVNFLIYAVYNCCWWNNLIVRILCILLLKHTTKRAN